MTEATSTPDGDIVQVRIPGAVAYVATLRLTTASLAARCDLTVDDIEDLRLAVDEACALLLPHATPDAPLDARFELSTGSLKVTAEVATAETARPDRDGFAWTVLGALADSVDVDHEAGKLSITVTKSREAAGT